MILRKTASTEVILHRNASKECSVWNLATALEVFMFAPFVLNLRTNFYQQGGGVEKNGEGNRDENLWYFLGRKAQARRVSSH